MSDSSCTQTLGPLSCCRKIWSFALLRCISHLPDTCGLNGAPLSSGSSIPLQINLLIKQSSQAFFSGPENCSMSRPSPTPVFLLITSLSLSPCSDLCCVCVRCRARFLSLCARALSLSLFIFLFLSLPLSFSLFLSLPLPLCLLSVSLPVSCFVNEIIV